MQRTHLSISFSIFFLWVLVLPMQFALAQTSGKIGLSSYLLKLETDHKVKFSFVDADIDGIQITIPNSQKLPEIIKSISSQTGIAIKQLSERYYALVKSKSVSICGRVLDNFAKNTIPAATVEVLGENVAVVTDKEGNFTLENVPRTASLKVRYLGYTTKIVPVTAFIETTECSKILLAERREILNEVVIYEFLAKGITKDTDGSITLNTGKLGPLPGLIEPDILFGVQALPGIKSIDETVSDINIRGGTNDQNLLLWNGIKMYQSGHFFGLISAFNPYLTEKVTIYKNGTPSQYGDGVSGIITMETKNTIEDLFYGGAGFNFISGDVFGQFPINEKLAFQFSARRSTTDFLNTPVYNSFTDRAFQDTEIRNQRNQRINQNVQYDEKFLFYDTSGKVLYDINEEHKLRFSFITINNDLDYGETNLDTSETANSFLDQKNLSAGLQWTGNWNEVFSTHTNIYYTQYDLDARSFFPNQVQRLFQENTVNELQAKLTNTFRFSNEFNWINGYQFIETGISNEARVTRPPLNRNVKDVVRIHAPFTNFNYSSKNSSIVASGGLRINYIENLDTFSKWVLEPRFNFNFKLANYIRVQFLGEFKSQSTNQVIDLQQNFLGIEKRRWTLSNEQDLPLTQSKQGSAGINYAKKQFYLGVEAFYKKVDGVSTRTQGFQNQNQFNGELGSYEVKGIEFLMNQKGDNYSTWMSYTYNNNDYTYNSITPPVFPNNLEVQHAITFGTTYEWKDIKLGLGINYRTGRPYTKPQESEPLDTTTFPAQINFEDPNSSRLPEYLRVDASANYSFYLGRSVKANAGVSILNLNNRQNILNRYYNVTRTNEIESVDNLSLGITPNISFRVYF